MPRGKDGSIIGDATAVSTSSASGIWTMGEGHKYRTEYIWPTKASGGSMTHETFGTTTYMFHTFLTDGNFIVNEAITSGVDVLVVGGGGAGGNRWGGGGGGGGAGIDCSCPCDGSCPPG